MNINSFSIKTKILSLAISIAIGVSTVALIVLYFSSGQISQKLTGFFQDETKKNIDNLVENVYNSCEISNILLNKLLSRKLVEAKVLISKKGGISISNEKFNWECINQFSKESKIYELPKVLIGGSWIGNITDFSKFQSIVDDMSEKHFTFTIFQKMNENGDMLRVATNVKLENGQRAIGTYIPAINPDGTSNIVLESVLKGITYYGTAYVVNDYYQTLYEPIKDNNGKIIGMLYSGISLNEIGELRESILNKVVGKTGYIYVLGGTGSRKGHYIISKNGQRDGENLWAAKDGNGEFVIQKIIKQAIDQPEGSVSSIVYPWKNKDDNEAHDKFVAITYFKPFDWVIGAGAELAEIKDSEQIIDDGFNEIYLYFAIALLISLIGISLTSLYLSNRIANPIIGVLKAVQYIANGNISDAKKEISDLENKYIK